MEVSCGNVTQVSGQQSQTAVGTSSNTDQDVAAASIERFRLQLPDELYVHAFDISRILDPRRLRLLSLVCEGFRKLVKDELWDFMYQRDFSDLIGNGVTGVKWYQRLSEVYSNIKRNRHRMIESESSVNFQPSSAPVCPRRPHKYVSWSPNGKLFALNVALSWEIHSTAANLPVVGRWIASEVMPVWSSDSRYFALKNHCPHRDGLWVQIAEFQGSEFVREKPIPLMRERSSVDSLAWCPKRNHLLIGCSSWRKEGDISDEKVIRQCYWYCWDVDEDKMIEYQFCLEVKYIHYLRTQVGWCLDGEHIIALGCTEDRLFFRIWSVSRKVEVMSTSEQHENKYWLFGPPFSASQMGVFARGCFLLPRRFSQYPATMESIWWEWKIVAREQGIGQADRPFELRIEQASLLRLFEYKRLSSSREILLPRNPVLRGQAVLIFTDSEPFLNLMVFRDAWSPLGDQLLLLKPCSDERKKIVLFDYRPEANRGQKRKHSESG